MDKKRLLGKRILKKIIEKDGSIALLLEDSLSEKLIEESPGNELYALQIAMFLKATKFGEVLQDRKSYEMLGAAGYQAILVRAMKETGFSYETVKSLGEDLVSALGYEKGKWSFPELADSEKLPFVKEENDVLRPDQGSVRGKEAYNCAVKWLQTDDKLRITNMNVALAPTMSNAAVWARRYLERAAGDGCLEACRLLGLCCYYGVGKAKNDQEAFSYLIQADGYTRGNYLVETRKVLLELLERQKKEKRDRLGVIFLMAGVALAVFLCGIIFEAVHLEVFLAAAVINLAAGLYGLIVRKSNEKKRNIFACTSLAIWCLLLLQICW